MLFKDLKEIVKTIEEKYNDYDVDNFKIILNEDEVYGIGDIHGEGVPVQKYDIDCGVNPAENYIRFTSIY